MNRFRGGSATRVVPRVAGSSLCWDCIPQSTWNSVRREGAMQVSRRRSLARRAITTALTFGIAGCAFQPHVEPLQIPTVPAQAFSGTLSPSEAATQPPAPDVPSPGEPGFDPDDPEAWIPAIEERGPKGDVGVCG